MFLEQQYVCVISKIDLIETYGPGDLPFEFFTALEDFSSLKMLLEQKGFSREHEPDQNDFVLSSYDRFRQSNPRETESKTVPKFVKIIWKLLDVVETNSRLVRLIGRVVWILLLRQTRQSEHAQHRQND